MEPLGPRVALSRLRQAAADGRLRAVAEAHGLDLVVVFGSVLDEAAEPRDIDLAVRGSESLDLLAVIEDLSDLAGTGLDVMDLRGAASIARVEALGRGVCLYEKQADLFAEAATIALVGFADTKWIRDMELERLAR